MRCRSCAPSSPVPTPAYGSHLCPPATSSDDDGDDGNRHHHDDNPSPSNLPRRRGLQEDEFARLLIHSMSYVFGQWPQLRSTPPQMPDLPHPRPPMRRLCNPSLLGQFAHMARSISATTSTTTATTTTTTTTTATATATTTATTRDGRSTG